MLPHINKLQHISTLSDFSQSKAFNVNGTKIQMIPKIYDSTNVYYNTIDNSYFMLVVCDELRLDTEYKNFLQTFLGKTITSSTYSLAVFSIENDKISLLDIKFLNHEVSINIDLHTQQNLIMDGLFIKGIRAEAQKDTEFPTPQTLEYGTSFTIQCVTDKMFPTQYQNINNKYRFPILLTNTDATVIDANMVFKPSSDSMFYTNNYVVSYKTNHRIYPKAGGIGFSTNNFTSYNISKIYRTELFSHIIPNVEDDTYIAIAHKDYRLSDYYNLDIHKDGTVVSYKKDYITSLEQINDKTFQVIKKGILYECKLHWSSGVFYDYKELLNLNTFKNGFYKKLHVVKIGDYLMTSNMPLGTFPPNNYDPWSYVYNDIQSAYNSYNSDWRINFKSSEPLYYEFKSFIVIPRKVTIVTSEILNNKAVKNVTTASGFGLTYISTKNETSVVRIDNVSNIELNAYDGELIYSSGNTSYYKINSNISFKNGDNISLVNITNNIGDINGAFKNSLTDSTNIMTFKIDPYEYDKNQTNFTTDIFIEAKDVLNLIFKQNKFISFVNPNNKYYLEQNGYIFDSLDDIKTNFMTILDQQFKNDEIVINDITSTNVNYINDIITIQNTVNKKLFAVYDNDSQLELNYNFITYNRILTTVTDLDQNNSIFKIDYFIDEDGTIYNTGDINFKFYNINNNQSNVFKLICNLEYDYIKPVKHNALTQVIYNISDLTSAENSYSKLHLIDLTNIDTTVIYDPAINVNVSSIDNVINLVAPDTTLSTYKADYNISGCDITSDMLLNIDVDIDGFSKSTNIHNDDVFSSIQNTSFLDFHFKDDINHSVLHFDLVGKTFNIYTMYLTSDREFYTLGALQNKCKMWLYGESNNTWYGDGQYKFYNILEHNTTKYFSNNNGFFAMEQYSRPESAPDYFPYAKVRGLIPISSSLTYGTSTTYINDSQNQSLSQRNDEDVIDIQPHDKEGHTLLWNLNLGNLNTLWTNQSTDTGAQISAYGLNYGTKIQKDSTGDLHIGTTIRPPYVDYPFTSPLFPMNNLRGFSLNNVSYNGNHTLAFVLNRKTDPSGKMERVYFDNDNVTNDTILGSRDYTTVNAGPIYDTIKFNKPILGLIENGLYTTYFTDFDDNTKSLHLTSYRQMLLSNLLEFDYELSASEINYYNANQSAILTQLWAEKTKMGLPDNMFISPGSFIFNVSRNKINVKIFKKYNIISIYVNNMLIEEIESKSKSFKLTDVVTYGNMQSGDQTITLSKLTNYITKKSGFWC